MSEMCEFYRAGKCHDADEGEVTCHFGGAWQDCEWGMPADPNDEGAGETEQAAGPAAVSAKAEKPCEHLNGVCASGCGFSGEEKLCPKYEPEGRLKIVYLPVDKIDPRPGNRDIGDVTELAASIGAEGIHTPLTVCPNVDGIEGRWTAVAGNRRHAAAKAAGLEEVPCIIRELDEAERITMMLSENTQRKEMTPLEEARAIQQLMLVLPKANAATVAKRTGISATTVRRRLKLTELDPEKAKAAEGRGVTLKDYEKLYELKDPKRRDKALEALGTKEFDRVFQLQKNADEDEAALARLVKSLERKGAVRLTPVETVGRKDLKCEKNIYGWQLTNASIGPLARDEEWFYTAEGLSISVYRKKKPEAEADNPKSAAEKAREELEELRQGVKEQLGGLRTELEQMEQDFLDLREKFIGDFVTHQRHREEIMEFAVRAMIYGCYWSDDRMKELAEWLGVEDPKDGEALGRAVRANPEKLLLLTAYCLMEKDAGSWKTAQYNTTVEERVVMHQRPARLDRLYEGLELLGYGMSTDEKKMQSGELMHFKQAARLVENFRAAKKDLDKRINA